MPSSANATLYGYQKPEGALWNFPATNTMVRIAINDNLKTYFGTTETVFGNVSPAQNMNYLSDMSFNFKSIFYLSWL
jgi:hypothetical protein